MFLKTFFLFLSQYTNCGYPQHMFWSKNKKKRQTPAYPVLIYKSGGSRGFACHRRVILMVSFFFATYRYCCFHRCGNVTSCYNEWYLGSSDDDKCRALSASSTLNYRFECTFCCIKDGCNVDLHPKADTLYTNT